MRQMTFEIPDEVAEVFLKDFPGAEERSVEITSYILRHRAKKVYTDAELIAAADAANADEVLNRDIEEWQSFSDPIEEPWDAPSPR